MTPRPFYWSVRREIWENRSIVVVPLIVTGFVLFGSLVGLMTLPRRLQALPPDDPAKLQAALIGPFSTAPGAIMFAALLVGFYYALDALYGERRDRSILFWKSLPVSDLTTVLAKASIPLAVLPLVAYLLSVFTTAVMLVVASAVLVASPVGPGRLWAELRYFQQVFIMFYGLAAHALWFAPIYGWLMLVSAWARRAPFLWAVVPFFVAGVLEKLVLDTGLVGRLLAYRFIGAMREAFDLKREDEDIIRLTQLDPVGFATSPGLWLGLIFAASFFVAAARLRRERDPI